MPRLTDRVRALIHENTARCKKCGQYINYCICGVKNDNKRPKLEDKTAQATSRVKHTAP